MVFPLNRQPPSGPIIDEGPATPCPPLFRTLYVDGQTLVDPADQDGAICSPFSTIQAALDSIPTPPDLSDFADLLQPFELLCAPGIYDEDVVIPTTGYSIAIRGNGRSGPTFPIQLFGSPSAFGTSILITSFGAGSGSINITASGSPWDDDPAVVMPSYQFADIFVDNVRFDATAVTMPDNLFFASIIFERCVVVEMDDQGGDFDQKWAGVFTVADSTFVTVEMPATGFQAERSLLAEIECADIYSADCAIDSAMINESGGFLTNAGLYDTQVLSLLDSSVAGFGFNREIFLDAATHYSASDNGALPIGQLRRVTEDNTRAIQATTALSEAPSTTTWVIDDGENSVIVGAAAGGRAVTLPTALERQVGGLGRVLGEIVIVKSALTSVDTVTVNPAGGNTIDGGPIALTSPGDGVVLLAVATARWTPIARTP